MTDETICEPCSRGIHLFCEGLKPPYSPIHPANCGCTDPTCHKRRLEQETAEGQEKIRIPFRLRGH